MGMFYNNYRDEMKKLIMVVFAAAAISGCAQQSSVNPGVTVQPQQITTHHFFVSGIGQSKQIDAAKVCGGADKVVRTEVQQTFVNGLLGLSPWVFILRVKRASIALNNCRRQASSLPAHFPFG
jgi:hypothetical protein